MVRDTIDILRKKFNPVGFQRSLAHITLKAQEDYVHEEMIVDVLYQFASKHPPVELELDGLRIHYDKDTPTWNIHVSFTKNCLLRYLTPQLSHLMEALVDLQSPNALQSTRWEQSDDYYPHISVLTGKNEISPDGILKNMQNISLELPKRITCGAIILKQWAGTKWKTVKRFDLSGSAN